MVADTLAKFKEFIELCTNNGVYEAKCGEMELKLTKTFKAVDLSFTEPEDSEKHEKEIMDTLFHSVTKDR